MTETIEHDATYTPKVVLVDPALVDQSGHHLRTLKGFGSHCAGEVWYAVNRRYRSDSGLPEDRVAKVFGTSIYDVWAERYFGRFGAWLRRTTEKLSPIKDSDSRFILARLYEWVRYGRGRPAQLARLLAAPFALPFLVFLRLITPRPSWTAPESIYRKDVLRLIRQLGLTGKDHIVIPTTDTELAAAVLDLSVELQASDFPTFHIRFMYTSNTWLSSHYDYENIYQRLKATQYLGRRIFLYSEMEALAHHISAITECNVEAVPYPVNVPEETAKRQKKKTDKIIVAFMGEAREDKGFDRLSSIISQFERLYPELLGRTKFLIHAAGRSAEHQQLRDAFRLEMALTQADIQFVEGVVDDADYDAMLASVDAFLLPYELEAYRLRGSGIVFEAVAAGRPFICTQGLSLQELGKGGNAAWGETDIELAQAIADVVANYNAFEKQARIARDTLKTSIHNNAIATTVSRLIENPIEVKTPPRLIMVSPWYPGGGSESVFEAQLRVLDALGFQVVTVFQESTPILARHESEDAKAFHAHIHRGTHGIARSVLSFKTYYSLHPLSLLDLLINRVAYDRFLFVERKARRHHAMPAPVKRFCKTSGPDVVLVNHLQSDGFAQRLPVPKGTPRILETHDIQSIQYQLRRGYLSQKELTQEIDAIGSYDCSVFLSKRERDIYFQNGGKENAKLIFPVLDQDNLDMTEIVSCPGYVNDHIRAARPAWNYDADLKSIDMLLVGSDHPANRDALLHLLNRLLPADFLPKHNLVVAGSVCQGVFPDNWREGVVPLGFTDDLNQLYAAAKLVLVPHKGGAGIPTKFLAAASRRKAQIVSASALTALGLDDLEREFIAHSDEEFTAKVARALSDPAYRVQLADEAHALYAEYFSPMKYQQAWQRLFHELGVFDAAGALLADDDVIDRPPYIEIDDVLRKYLPLLGSQLDQAGRRRLLKSGGSETHPEVGAFLAANDFAVAEKRKQPAKAAE